VQGIALHWTAGDYDRIFSAYHVCLRGAHDVEVVVTHDLRANMRDLRREPDEPYAAHVAGRNSFLAGIAICAMEGATPHDFGRWPLTPMQLDALVVVARELATAYALPVDTIRTHAEFACDDGYFGCGDDERWDIARLEPSDAPLAREEARAVGDVLRARIAA
jgi:hypothetical protein